MKTAVVLNGVVWNVVEGAASPAVHPGAQLVDVTSLQVSPGDEYDGVAFARPLINRVSRARFLARMTDNERADMEIASVPVAGDNQGTARQRALVAQFLRYLEGTVDLAHPRINGVRGALTALGVLAPGRVAAVFDPRRDSG